VFDDDALEETEDATKRRFVICSVADKNLFE
jgi:hypothetical protein